MWQVPLLWVLLQSSRGHQCLCNCGWHNQDKDLDKDDDDSAGPPPQPPPADDATGTDHDEPEPQPRPVSPRTRTYTPSKSDDESDQAWGSWRDDGKGQEEWVSYDEGQEGYDDDVRDRNGLPPGGGPRNRAIYFEGVGPTGSARGTFKANAIRVLSGVTGAPLIRVTGAEANPRPVVIDLTRATASRAGPVPPPGAVPLLANPASLTPTVYHGNLGKEAEPAQPLVVQLVTAGWKNLHNLKEIHGKIVAEPAPKWAHCPSKAAMDAQLRRLVCPQALQALGSRYK